MNCPQCQAEVLDNAVFCQACGARLGEVESATTDSPNDPMAGQPNVTGAQTMKGLCEICGQELGVNEKLRGLTTHERCPSLVAEAPAQAVGALPSQHQPTRRALAADEMYCYSCGNVMKKEAVMCVSCGVPSRRAQVPVYAGGLAGRGEGKSKVASILLAIFFGNWTWLYTYREDGTKFWIALAVLVVGLILSIVTLGIGLLLYIPASLAIWIWAIVDAVSRSDEWYARY